MSATALALPPRPVQDIGQAVFDRLRARAELDEPCRRWKTDGCGSQGKVRGMEVSVIRSNVTLVHSSASGKSSLTSDMLWGCGLGAKFVICIPIAILALCISGHKVCHVASHLLGHNARKRAFSDRKILHCDCAVSELTSAVLVGLFTPAYTCGFVLSALAQPCSGSVD